jgi:hypothetical protein
MKKVLAFAFVLLCNLCSSQVQSIIINGETKEVIPYVNISVPNEDIGTTSNEKGAFVLNVVGNKIILLSAIGFETKKIASETIKDTLELTPLINSLDEILLIAKKSTEELVVDSFKKSKIDVYFACGSKPWITAKYFEFKEDYGKTIFLDKLRILTDSDIADSKFNVRLYSINDKGEPQDYIHDENIIGIAKKGKKLTTIDLSNLNIKFPKEGFFVALEWLIIDDNKYEYSYRSRESGEQINDISYEPGFGTVSTLSDIRSWTFQLGNWSKMPKNWDGLAEKYVDEYQELAIELTLTN